MLVLDTASTYASWQTSDGMHPHSEATLEETWQQLAVWRQIASALHVTRCNRTVHAEAGRPQLARRLASCLSDAATASTIARTAARPSRKSCEDVCDGVGFAIVCRTSACRSTLVAKVDGTASRAA